MSKLLTPGHCRIAIQICAMTAVAALMSGCSADSNRFGDAFGNPFATGSIQKPKKVVHKAAPVGTGRTPPVTASALPPANHVAAAAPVRPASGAVSHETTGSIPSSRPVPGASFGGWTGQGGASVQVGAGDTAAVLAQRYGVPETVLLQTNGLHAASEVQPGTTIVIPIYNAVATSPGAARVAQAPARSEPAEPEEHVAPVKTVPAHVAKAEPAKPEPAEEPARKPAALPFKVERPTTLAERNAEAQRIVATQRAADKAAAEKLAAAQKAAEAQKLAEARKAAAAEKVAAAEKAKADAAARRTAAKSAPAAKAEAAKVAAAQKAAAAQKLAADREAAKAKAEAARTAAAAAKAAKVAAAVPAKPAALPAKPAAAPAKPEQVAAVDKKVDVTTPTASVPPATPAPAAAPAAAADAGGPEFRWPARGRIIGGFKTGGNDGINIAVPEGTAVKAAEGGTVAYAGNELKGYGNMVLIRHPNGYVSAYANNGEIEVKKGDVVKRGQMIAKSGQTGDVSSPQLHFELRKGSTPVDPTNLLAGT